MSASVYKINWKNIDGIDNQQKLKGYLAKNRINHAIKFASKLNPGINRSYKILSLSGGGLRIINTTYLMKRISEEYKINFNDFDKIAGVSAGSIVAGFVRSNCSADEIHQSIIDDGNKIFSKKNASIGGIIFNSYYSKLPLTNQINKKIGNKIFKELDKELFIIATNLSNGKNFLSNYNTPNLEISKAVLASYSVPVLFDYEKINDEVYTDGGFVANQPALYTILETIIKTDAKNWYSCN